MKNTEKYLELMDTSLRDGEQTPGVSYTPTEKLQIARALLDRVRVDRIEVASARVSEGEREGARKIIEWADKKGKLESVEILGFIDGGKSIDWIRETGGRVINMLTKGSEKHCRIQLRKTPEEHFALVCKDIEYAIKKEMLVNVYLEDWSNGMRDSFPYVYEFTKRLNDYPIERIMLPDTLGVLDPYELARYLDWMHATFPESRFDFHGHNDYGLGTANCLQAARSGVNAVHATVNGLGERAGNPSLCELIPVIHDHSGRKTHVNEKQLDYVAKLVEALSGKRLANNAPIIGNDVFTQTCGVHADGDKKGNLYANPLIPERFGKKRRYALGKLSGKASIDKNLEALGMELEPEIRDRVLKEVIRFGDRKKKVTPDDLPFIIADVLKTGRKQDFSISDYYAITKSGELPNAGLTLNYKNQTLKAKATGDGGYDAFMKALRKCLRQLNLKCPKLLDYEVRIPPGGKTDALVETTITWANGNKAPVTTVGVDCDQIDAAIEATEKMLNLILTQDV